MKTPGTVFSTGAILTSVAKSNLSLPKPKLANSGGEYFALINNSQSNSTRSENRTFISDLLLTAMVSVLNPMYENIKVSQIVCNRNVPSIPVMVPVSFALQ